MRSSYYLLRAAYSGADDPYRAGIYSLEGYGTSIYTTSAVSVYENFNPRYVFECPVQTFLIDLATCTSLVILDTSDSIKKLAHS